MRWCPMRNVINKFFNFIRSASNHTEVSEKNAVFIFRRVEFNKANGLGSFNLI